MSEQHSVIVNLELNVSRAMDNAQRIETLMYHCLSLANRLGLPENIRQAINLVQRWTMAVRLATTATALLQAARMSAGDPIAWATFLVGTASAAVYMGDLMMESN